MNKIVADTGSLITLEKIPDGFDFVTKIFDKIIIPPAVMRETSEGFSTLFDYLSHFKISHLIEVKSLPLNIHSELLILDQGEREAISLAAELKLDLLIEEKKGKRIANHLGIKAFGIAGLIYKAFRSDIISKETSVDYLKVMIGANRLNKTVYDALLKAIHKDTF
jgi:hypothetical protein